MDADGIPLAFDIFLGNQNEQTTLKPLEEKVIRDFKCSNETDEKVFNTIYYKELPLVTGNMDETVIITYSPKYKAYQQKIRKRQIEHAQKMIQNSGSKRRGKNQNDPARFIKKVSVTDNDEIKKKSVYALDEERITQEAQYILCGSNEPGRKCGRDS